MERIKDKIMKNQTWISKDQVWKLEDCEDQIRINKNQVWEPKD